MKNEFLASAIRAVGMKKQEKKYPFKEARLVESANGRWYVIFYVWNENSKKGQGDLERKRVYDINKYPDLEVRRTAGETLVDNINGMLRKGWCIKRNLPQDQFKSRIDINIFTLKEAIELHMENNKNTLSKQTIKWYGTLLNTLSPWLDANGIGDIRLIDFNLEMANAFFSYLKNEKVVKRNGKEEIGVGNKTYNNYLTYFNAVYNAYVNQELIKKKKNVIQKLKKKRTQSGKHAPFSHSQLQLMYNRLSEAGEASLLLFIQFVYYTFSRPGSETRFIQVKHIHESTIFIPAENAKGDRGEHISIPPDLEKLIDEHDLRSYPAEFYIFTNNGKPGPEPAGINYFYRQHKKYLEELDFTDKPYTLYSYKHTGNIMLYLAGADPIAIQKHNRHTSLDQTLKYLRDLGMIRNEDVIQKFPRFADGELQNKKGELLSTLSLG
jgi:integrase